MFYDHYETFRGYNNFLTLKRVFRIIAANYIEIVKRNEKFVSKFAPVPDTFYFENGAIFDY